MHKKLISLLLAVTLLATCLTALPVVAEDESTTLFTFEPGGAWSETYADNAAVLNRTYALGSRTYTYDAATQTATWDGAGERGASASASAFMDLSGLTLNSEATGSATVEMNVSIDLYDKKNTGDPFYMGTNDAGTEWMTSKDSKSPTWHALSFSAYVDGAFKKGPDQDYGGLISFADVTNTNADGEFDTSKRTLNVKTYYPRKGDAGAAELDWNSSAKIPIKMEITKGTDGFTIKQYAKPDGTNWVSASVSNTRLDQTVTGNKFTGFGFFTGNNNMNDYNRVKYTFSDAKVTQSVPATVRLTDLTGKVFLENKTAPFDFVLPEGVTDAKLSVGGTDIYTFAAPNAGAYTGSVDLSKLGKSGNLTLTLSGTANGEPFSASTAFAVKALAKGTLDANILTQPTASNAFAPLQMDGAAFLNQQPSGINYEYNSSTKTAIASAYGSYETTGTFLEFGELAFNTAGAAVMEIEMNVSVEPGAPDSWDKYNYNKDEKTPQMRYDKFQFNPIIDGTAVKTGEYKLNDEGVPTKQSSVSRYNSGVYFWNKGYGSSGDTTPHIGPRNAARDARVDANGGVVKYKIVITKANGLIHYTQLYNSDGTWIEDGSNGLNTVVVSAGNLTGLQVWMGNELVTKDSYVNWKLSDVQVTEKVDYAIGDLSGTYYTDYGTVPVDFKLPEDFQTASLTIGGKTLAEFDAEGWKGGAYSAQLNLNALGMKDHLELVLSGTTKSGGTFAATTTVHSGVDENWYNEVPLSANVTFTDADGIALTALTAGASVKATAVDSAADATVVLGLYQDGFLKAVKSGTGSAVLTVPADVVPANATLKAFVLNSYDDANTLLRAGLWQSGDATLADILIDGVSLEGFSNDKDTYEIVRASKNQMPDVVPVPNDSAASAVIKHQGPYPGTTTITVIANDGTQKIVNLKWLKNK